MYKYLLKLFPLFIAFLLFIPYQATANNSFVETREGVFSFLESAFKAQVSLSEKPRSLEGIEGILAPYFSESYQKAFLEANLFEEKGKFLTYGSDFAPYYIPFYQFSEKTKVSFSDEKIYVFEHFEKNMDGPVTYEDHYEGLLIVKNNGSWKVSEYLYDNLPEEIIAQDEDENDSANDEKFKEEAKAEISEGHEIVGNETINLLANNTMGFSLIEIGYKEHFSRDYEWVKAPFIKVEILEQESVDRLDEEHSPLFTSPFKLEFEIKPFKLIHLSAFFWLEKRLSLFKHL